MPTNNHTSKAYKMPTYMPLKWEARNLKAEIRPVGIKRIKYIPFRLHFPYFSGTMLELQLEMNNDSQECREIHYKGILSPLFGIPHRKTIAVAEGDLKINPKSKIKQKLRLAHLPQPGNYSFRLELRSEGQHPQGIAGDMVYFDALPKDASAFNVGLVIIGGISGGIIGVIIGFVLGKLWG